MITLLSDRLAPVTSTIGLLNVPVDAAAEAVSGWRRRLDSQVSLRELRVPLPDAIGHLQPLTGGVRPRELLVATGSAEWTAYFDCGVGGSDPRPVVGYLTKQLLCSGVVVCAIPETRSNGLEQPGRYGAVQFELHGPLKAGTYLTPVRSISVTNEGRWRFDTEGTVQDFEDVDRYGSRRIRDRFTTDLLVRYCAALGLRPLDEDFYRDRAVLVTSDPHVVPSGKVLSIDQTQDWLGIRPGIAESLKG